MGVAGINVFHIELQKSASTSNSLSNRGTKTDRSGTLLAGPAGLQVAKDADTTDPAGWTCFAAWVDFADIVSSASKISFFDCVGSVDDI